MGENIKRVGMPEWSAEDQKLARAIQKEIKVKEQGLLSKVDGVREELVDEIKSQIARGEYLTEDKLNEAIYRLLREIMADEERVS